MAFDVQGARKAGYSDSEIADHLAQENKFDISSARQHGYTDEDIIGHLVTSTAPVEQYDREPDSVATRFHRGMVEPLVGANQRLAHMGVGDQQLADTAAHEIESDIRAGKPDGIDWATMGGNALMAAPAAVVAVEGAIPTMAMGAGLGAANALTSPIDSKNYGGETALRTGAGVVGGALVPVALQKAVGTLIPVALARFGTNPTQILNHITVTLRGQGIDFAKLGSETQDWIKQQVSGALSKGGTLNEKELGNAATLRAGGVQNPTSAQISQNPTEYGTELYLRHQQGGEPLAAQYQGALGGLNDSIRGLQNKLMPPLDTPAAGARIMQPLEQAGRRGQELVTRGYNQFKASNPDAVSIDGQAFAHNVLDLMQQEPGMHNLPKSLITAVNQMSSNRAGTPNLINAEAINQEISRQLQGATPAQTYALTQFKKLLDDEITNSAERAGSDSAGRLMAARGLAEQRFAQHDAIPALKDVANGNATPDTFMRDYVTGAGKKATVENNATLKAFLQKTDPQAVSQIKGQIVSDLQTIATKGKSDTFLQNQYNTALRTLEKTGKLKVWFNADEIATLKNIGKAGELLEGPQGVARTGLLGGARAAEMLSKMVSILGVLPGGKFIAQPVSEAIKRVPLRAASNNALNPKLVNPSQVGRSFANRLSPTGAIPPYLMDEAANQ